MPVLYFLEIPLVQPQGEFFLPLLVILVLLLILSFIPVLLKPAKKKKAGPPQTEQNVFQQELALLHNRWEQSSIFFTSLASLPEPEKVFELIPTYVSQLLKAKFAVLFLKDSRVENRFGIKAEQGLSLDTAQKLTLSGGEDFVRYILHTGRLAHLTLRDRQLRSFIKYPEQFNEIILLPLKSQEEVLGILLVANKLDQAAFSKEDLETLTFIIHPITFAVKNSLQYETIRRLVIGQIIALANSLEKRDLYTRGHSDRVAQLCDLLSQQIYLSADERETLKTAALLHDVGKIGIRDVVLLKPGKLTDEEYAIIKTHPRHGADILKPLEFMLKKEIPLILYHHERWDGKGYPEGLKKDRIPLGSRIMALADTYDAMTSDRPYRNAFSPEEALDKMKDLGGTQFDPELLSIFIRIIKRQLQEQASRKDQVEEPVKTASAED